MASTSISRKCWRTLKKIDSFKGRIYSNTIHVNMWAPPTIQVKLADQALPLWMKPNMIGVTLNTQLIFRLHCNNIASKLHKPNVESTGLVYMALRQINLANDLSSNWPHNAQILLPRLDAITQGHHMDQLLRGQSRLWKSLPAVLRWKMSPMSTKRLGTEQFASIPNWFRSISILHSLYRNIPAIRSPTDRRMSSRIDDDLW